MACGLLTVPRLAEHNLLGGHDGLFHTGSFAQLGSQVVGVVVVVAFAFLVSYMVFCVIDKTYGLRVSARDENAGRDISQHGMYGYPEQFIPAP